MSNLFDPNAEVHRDEHCLPHWMQDGVITFVTMRQADSLPLATLQRWERERLEFLREHGIRCQDWRRGREHLPPNIRKSFDKCFHRKREMELDKGHGSCRLRDRRAAQIVHDALLHFDGERYLMGDFVVMPNHVHLLVVFMDATNLRKQCYSWMHFSATKINRLFGQSGVFWQEEPFDHLVRSEKQLEYLRDYIEHNSVKAKLNEGEYLYRRSSREY